MAHAPKPSAAPPHEPEADPSKIGHTENGIPADAAEAEPTGLPTSDRHHNETAPSKT